MSEPRPADDHFETLLDYLRRFRGVDLSAYKPATLLRRISKRMEQVKARSMEDYLDYIEVHPEEFARLLDAILINVTGFFRYPEGWEALRRVIEVILAGKGPHDPIRVWSAGCSSGEEAFTLAMILAEALGAEEFGRRVKIYATDIDEDALAKARQAIYDAKSLEAVPAELRSRYFEKAGRVYAFRGDMRRAVIFGRHDLIKDAPISRLDLLVCRNTLIYFTADTQGQILARFHFALNPKGVLFLGKSEMLISHADLFQPVNQKHRIFAKTGQVDSGLLALASGDGGAAASPSKGERLADNAFAAVPLAQLVVDAEGTLVLANAPARSMLGLSPGDVGRHFQDLAVSYRPVELRSPIEKAQKDRAAVRIAGVERALDSGEVQYLDVLVTPLQGSDGVFTGVVISFEDGSEARRMQMDLQRAKQELETTNEELQSSNEELETTNEELQSTVEELETTNEELQSTNEEHETINEELQSSNEELRTINEQLHGRTDELKQANALLEGILAGLGSAAVVVDRNIRVLIWNQKAADLWGLRVDEVRGQPLTALDIGLPVSHLLDPLRACLGGSGPPSVTVDAVDRRGRKIRCRVTFTPLAVDGEMRGAIMLMGEVS